MDAAVSFGTQLWWERDRPAARQPMILPPPVNPYFCSTRGTSRGPKACAGGLTSKAVQALRYSIDPVVRKVVRRVRLEGEARRLARDASC